MFGVDDGQGSIRQLAWYIWGFLKATSGERPALDNWLLAERFIRFGDRPSWLWDDARFRPFDDPNADA